MRATILIRLKSEVFDAQGRELVQRINDIGHAEVTGARVGKVIDLELDAGDRENAVKRITDLCKNLLANSVIEDFTILEIE
jgi:phosphoribosylformylglycinamidine synthase